MRVIIGECFRRHTVCVFAADNGGDLHDSQHLFATVLLAGCSPLPRSPRPRRRTRSRPTAATPGALGRHRGRLAQRDAADACRQRARRRAPPQPALSAPAVPAMSKPIDRPRAHWARPRSASTTSTGTPGRRRGRHPRQPISAT